MSGGCTTTSYACSAYKADILRVTIDSSGNMGTWETLAGTLFSARFGHATLAYNGKLYVVGGCTAQSSSSCTTAGVLADVRYSTLDVNVGASWTSTTSLPNGRVWHRAEVYSGRVYIIGGINTTPALATNGYYSSVIDGSGNIASFTANLGPSRTRYDLPQSPIMAICM